MTILNFKGFIKNVTYKAFLNEPLTTISLEAFNVNQASSYGLIQADNHQVAYSKWVSPKRTRSYPFARIYNTYNASKILTIIPVIKDEGKDGDRDRIQYSTISWMNLLNIYIVLAYYETAEKSLKKGQSEKDKLTTQLMNNDFVKAQIQEIVSYKQSALHWNKHLFENRFTSIFEQALDCYDTISQQTGVKIHSREPMNHYLAQITHEFETFKDLSLKSSQSASYREAMTSHNLEYLIDGHKSTFSIENYLGGVYYLTPDEIIENDDIYIIQESKNTSQETLPQLSDIQDGLFKLILFANLDKLILNNKEITFTTKLKLTGKNIIGALVLPNSNQDINDFLNVNQSFLNHKQQEIIKKLALEAQHNKYLIIEITSNTVTSASNSNSKKKL